MIRTQIQLTSEQAALLKRRAAEEGLSMAELVRRSLEGLAGEGEMVPPEEKRRRALAAIGALHGPAITLSRRHDDYAAEAFG